VRRSAIGVSKVLRSEARTSILKQVDGDQVAFELFQLFGPFLLLLSAVTLAVVEEP
jgi:hypothetical protein